MLSIVGKYIITMMSQSARWTKHFNKFHSLNTWVNLPQMGLEEADPNSVNFWPPNWFNSLMTLVFLEWSTVFLMNHEDKIWNINRNLLCRRYRYTGIHFEILSFVFSFKTFQVCLELSRADMILCEEYISVCPIKHKVFKTFLKCSVTTL